MLDIFILLLLFQLKHFICDYPLQTQYMLGKMSKTGWFLPLLAHSSIHAIGTFIIAVFYNFYLALVLAVIDLVLHFIVDRLKASPTLGGRWKPDQPYFWWALGLDQMVHHVINYVFVLTIIIFTYHM